MTTFGGPEKLAEQQGGLQRGDKFRKPGYKSSPSINKAVKWAGKPSILSHLMVLVRSK